MDDQLRARIGQVLRTSPDGSDAKIRISGTVKQTLRPRPDVCVVTVIWSPDPDGRIAKIYPEGHEAFIVFCRRQS